MSELADVFGDDFEEEYESERQERRQAQNQVDEDTLKEICYKAVNGGFKGSEPRFTYEGDAVPHDVFLMQAPESKMHKFKNKFENGGMSFGMFHLEDIYGCNFNEDLMNLVEQVEEGKHYIVVGRYSQERVTKGGEEEVYDNVNVRGIVPVAAAKKWAQKREQEKSESSIEEQKEDQGVEDTEDSGSDEATDEEITKVFKAVGDKKPEVLSDVADGDEEALSKLVALVDKNVSGDVTEDHVRSVFESEIEEIDDGEDEEDDDMGLDDLDMGDDEDEETEEETTNNDESSDDETDEASEEDEDDIDEWF